MSIGRREAVDEVEALGPRAHDRHLAAQDIDQLRKLVELGARENASHRRHARIVG